MSIYSSFIFINFFLKFKFLNENKKKKKILEPPLSMDCTRQAHKANHKRS